MVTGRAGYSCATAAGAQQAATTRPQKKAADRRIGFIPRRFACTSPPGPDPTGSRTPDDGCPLHWLGRAFLDVFLRLRALQILFLRLAAAVGQHLLLHLALFRRL